MCQGATRVCVAGSTQGIEVAGAMQVIKPLLPKSKGKEEPRALRSFSEAERLMGEDARFLRAPSRDRCTACHIIGFASDKNA